MSLRTATLLVGLGAGCAFLCGLAIFVAIHARYGGPVLQIQRSDCSAPSFRSRSFLPSFMQRVRDERESMLAQPRRWQPQA